MEDQGDQLDFQSVRAMFQDKECLLGQPKNKPVVLEKPKPAPSPQSPTYLPAGARPSLLTTMNQALEAKTLNYPRVVFKDEKKESKMPLIQTSLKGKDKSDKKAKESKDKTAKEDKEKLLDSSNQKEKKEDGKDKKFSTMLTHKEPTAELIQVSPRSKATTLKKKGFSGFKKGTKRDSAGTSVDQILDTPSVDKSGPAPLIPVPSDTGHMLMEPLYSIPKARPLNKMTLPDPSSAVNVTPPSHNTEPRDFSSPIASVPDVPILRASTSQSKTSAEIQNPALPLSSPASHSEVPNPPRVAPALSNQDSSPTSLTVASSTRPTIAPPAPPNCNNHSPPTVAVPASTNNKTSTPSNVAAPALPNHDSPLPPPVASPTRPTIAPPAPPKDVTRTPPTIASAAPPNHDTPIPPTVAAPAPPKHKTPIPLTVAAPAPPNRTSSIHPTVAAPAPPNHDTPTLPTVAAPAPPKHKTSNPPTVAAPPNVNASIPPPIAAPALFSNAAPTPPNSDTLNLPPSASPAPLNADSPVPDPLLCATPDPTPGLVLTDPLPVVSALSPSPPALHVAAKVHKDTVKEAAVEKPHSPETDSSQSSKSERPISALSVLGRVEDKSLGKKTPPGDRRILNALENARKKSASPLLSSPLSHSATPPPEEPLSQESPTHGLPALPPIDYEGGNPASPKPVNGTDHQETSPIWEGIKKEKSDGVPVLVVPSPPPKQALPDLKYLDSAPEKPDRSLSDSLNEFIPPPPLFKEGSEVLEAETKDDPEFEELPSDAYSPELPSSGLGNELGADVSDRQNQLEYHSNGIADPESEVLSEPANEDDYEESPAPVSSIPVSQDPPPMDKPDNRHSIYEETENAYEDINISPSKKKRKNNSGKKLKGTLKNPYVESTQETVQEKTKTGRFGKSEKKSAVEKPDEKELKKKEKQQLEKAKKEQKEKMEREKKEQKEREKKENEMKKKFKITGQEEAMYQAKVTETTKGSKKNLPVKCGDIVSIIRTNNCPKGMWLARDSKNNYGYVTVNHVSLDIKEMLEMGKKARNSIMMEPENTSKGQWTSNHIQATTESFTDDSDEWSGDEDDTLSPAPETDQFASGSHNRTFSMPDMGNKDLSINHQHSRSDVCDNSQTQARHEALQKLATFLQSPKPADPTPSDPEPEMSPVLGQEEAVSEPEDSSQQEAYFDPTAVILPPPDQYADTTV